MIEPYLNLSIKKNKNERGKTNALCILSKYLSNLLAMQILVIPIY